MTDTFEVRGDSSPAETFTATDAIHVIEDAAPIAPNGFLKLALAPELIRAVEDLGFTQPTPVQDQVIPLALPNDDEGTGFIELMVSAQTGSGKAAAFLRPGLHTLLKQHA